MGHDPRLKVLHRAVGLMWDWEERFHVHLGRTEVACHNQCFECFLGDMFTVHCQQLCKDCICMCVWVGGGMGRERGSGM